MTNISSNPLSTDKQGQLFDELTKLLSKLSATHIKSFLENLLGPEEQIMLTKRFSAIVLLEQGYSRYKISKSLHLSESTVTTINNRRLSGHYKDITRWLKKDKRNIKKFLEMLESVLTFGGIVPQYGQGHKALRKLIK